MTCARSGDPPSPCGRRRHHQLQHHLDDLADHRDDRGRAEHHPRVRADVAERPVEDLAEPQRAQRDDAGLGGLPEAGAGPGAAAEAGGSDRVRGRREPGRRSRGRREPGRRSPGPRSRAAGSLAPVALAPRTPGCRTPDCRTPGSRRRRSPGAGRRTPARRSPSRPSPTPWPGAPSAGDAKPEEGGPTRRHRPSCPQCLQPGPRPGPRCPDRACRGAGSVRRRGPPVARRSRRTRDHSPRALSLRAGASGTGPMTRRSCHAGATGTRGSPSGRLPRSPAWPCTPRCGDASTSPTDSRTAPCPTSPLITSTPTVRTSSTGPPSCATTTGPGRCGSPWSPTGRG